MEAESQKTITDVTPETLQRASQPDIPSRSRSKTRPPRHTRTRVFHSPDAHQPDEWRARSRSRHPRARTPVSQYEGREWRSRSRSPSPSARYRRARESRAHERDDQRRSSRRSTSRDRRIPFDERAREFMTQFSNMFSTFNGNCTNRENFSNTTVIPEFDPSLKNQSINNWLTKVNESAVLYGWSERQIIHYALPKLSGVAKKWYEGLPSLLFSWSEWQTKLRSAFPAEENYGQMLSEMLSKRAKFGESLEEYFYDKVALLNRCEIHGKRAVECILHGIDDKKEKTVLNISDSRSNDISAKYVQEVFVNGQKRTCFIDLGSELTLIRESDAKQLFGKWESCESRSMVGFGGGVVHSLGRHEAELKIQEVVACVQCVVVPDHFLKYSLLIGQTFTEQKHIRIVKNDRQLIIESCYNHQDYRRLQLRVKADSTINGADLLEIDCDSDFEGTIFVRGDCRTQPNREYSVGEGVYTLKKGSGAVFIIPLSNQSIHFKKGELISRAEVVLHSFGTCEIMKIQAAPLEPLTLPQLNVGDILEQDKLKLLNLINQYRDCFATSLSELGRTELEKMKIELNDDQPIVYRPYRLSQQERREVQDMVDELSKNGIVRESTSPFASPIILVRKKTGDKRLCVDYRALNRKTIKQHYPLPCMEDQMNRLSGCNYYCTLDLANGYYQIELAEESKPKTAFITPDGQWEFNRMPFGLVNAPAVFQRAVNKALGSLRFNTAVAYMDDVLVPSESIDDGLDKLERIFKRLREFNMTLKPSKCYFFQTTVDFLGFEVSAGGIRPGKRKIEAVQDFPVPRDVHNVRQFLGLASFFRKFIRGFAALARPLTGLLRNNTPWVWGADQQASFDELKQKLVSRPVLALYDPSLSTELHTDASKWGVGGILLQRQIDGELKPVAYYSRQTSSVEQHFSSYELETLAVVSSLSKFRPYLLGMPFTILTDCNSLRATFMKRDMIPRVARWWGLIQEFDCEVKYKSGSGMCHVDALSRNPIPSSAVTELELPSVLHVTDDWLKTVQSADSEVERIKSILLDPNSKNVVDVRENFCLKNNNVYRLTDDGPKWLVPKGVRWQILKDCHDDIGHFSLEKTLDKVKQTYWFPKLNKFVKKYVQSCLECAHSKTPSGKKSGYLHPIPRVSKPFDTLHADHLGPFNQSKRKNKYLLLIVDSYSKFVILKPVRNTKASTTIKIFREYFATFGCPVRLITDRYSSFTGKALKAFLEEIGIKHIMNAVATPRANGQVERYNRTVLDSLTAINHGRDESLWDEKVLDVQWGLNNTLNKGINKTPAEVLFGLKLTSMSEGRVKSSLDSDLESSRGDLVEIRKEVDEHVTKTQSEQKSRFDKTRCEARKFKEGDLVRVERSILCPGKSKKLISKCLGPYKITKVFSNDRYMVEDTPITRHKGKAIYRAVHPVDKIFPWLNFHRSDESDSDSIDSTNTTNDNITEDVTMNDCSETANKNKTIDVMKGNHDNNTENMDLS